MGRTLYQIDSQGIYTGNFKVIGPKEGRRRGWIETDQSPPEGIAQWGGSSWTVLDKRPEVPVTRSGTISRTQAFLALRVNGNITQTEARQAVSRNALPFAIITAIDSLPVELQETAEIRAWGAETIPYGDSLLQVFAGAFNLTDEQVDNLWDAAKLL